MRSIAAPSIFDCRSQRDEGSMTDNVIDGIPEKARPALMEMSDTQKTSFLSEYSGENDRRD